MDTPDYAGQSLALDDTRLKLVELNTLAEKFGTAMTKAFASGIAHGKSLDAVLQTVGQKFIEIGLKSAFQPLEGLVTSTLGSLTRGLTGSFGSLFGGGGVSGPVMPFADGGVIAAPSYFPLGRGTGLAGEAGPEAILPLSRGADGRLGVAASGGASAPVYVTIQTPDVESFARSESQVAAALARAVARGRRAT